MDGWDAGWLLTLLSLVMVIHVPTMQTPWGRDLPGINGAFYGLQARNLLRWEAETTLGGGILNTGEPGRSVPSFYMHHPPALVWLTAAAFALLGESEGTARWVQLLATLGSLWLLYGFARQTYGRVAAVGCGLAFSLMPMCSVYGTHVDVHGPLAVFAMLGGVLSARDFFSGGSAYRMWAWWVLGMLVDWPLFLLPHLVLVYGWWLERRGRVVAGVLTGVALVWLTLALVLIHAAWGRGGLAFLSSQLKGRTLRFIDDQGDGFTALEWLERIGEHAWSLFTWPVLVLAAVWLIWMWLSRQREGLWVLLMAALALADVVVGAQASYVHDVWQIYLWPVLALMVGRVLSLVRGPLWLRWAAPVMNSVLIAWAGWRQPYEDSREGYGYTCKEVGVWIQLLSKADEAVVLVGEGTASPALYYYADRIMAPYVYDVASLHDAIQKGEFHGPLGFPVSSQMPVNCVVVAKTLAASYPALINELRTRWVESDVGAVLAYRRKD
jgi:hypothetical protein